MSTYCSSIPKYVEHISATVPKSIAAILQEHKRRHGDSTKDTANKPFDKRERPGNIEQEPGKQNKEKEKKEWEEMLANCGETFYPTFLSRRNRPLQIRDEPLIDTRNQAYMEKSDERSDEEEVQMPMEAFMTDEELEQYRKNQHPNVTLSDGQSSGHATRQGVTQEEKAGNEFEDPNQQQKPSVKDIPRNLRWREPPKALPKATPEYVVEFPPEETSPEGKDLKLRNEEEDALALTLVTGMNLVKKRAFVDYDRGDDVLKEKKPRYAESTAPEAAFSRMFGNFSMGHNAKKEAAGKHLPPPPQ